MKLNLVLLTVLSTVSALPVIQKRANNPYLVCGGNDYECKKEQANACYAEANQCWSTGSDVQSCSELGKLCDEIWTYSGEVQVGQANKVESVGQINQVEEVEQVITTIKSVKSIPTKTIANTVKAVPSTTVTDTVKSVPNDLNESNSENVQNTKSNTTTANLSSGSSNTFQPSKENVKILGRGLYQEKEGSLWIGLTDSGVEYKFNGKTTTISLTADSSAASTENPARIVILADGELYEDTTVKSVESEFEVTFGASGEHTVRFMKVSECANGTVRITAIKADAEKIEPTADADKKIEFIGDSITCAYGVDGTEGTFSTKTEDGTKSYAYLASKQLNADYSMFSFSGFGIISGYSTDGTRNKVSTVPQYYEKLGFSYWTQFGSDITQLKEVSWDASQFVPDLVVINLGTNDNSYMQNVKGDRAKEEADFVADYVKFIEQIRSVHPDAEILCTLGIMGQELYPQIEEAVSTYKAASGDEKVNAYKFNQQDINKNGKGIDWHPAPQSHVEAAEELVAEIKKLYGWGSTSASDSGDIKTFITTKALPPTSTTAKAPPKTIPKSSTKASPTGVTTKAPPAVATVTPDVPVSGAVAPATTNTFKPSKENVKILGRGLYQEKEGSLWIGLTDSGVEYKFNGKTTTISLTADSSAASTDNPARIVILADGELYEDTTVKSAESEFEVTFGASGEHTVRFMKVSECANGTVRITAIKADAEKIEPTADADKKIEFIGDSITCAYGVDGTEGTFSTKTEDGTKSYAYLASKQLNADYSMFSFSGFGIISGYSTDGTRNEVSTVPQYYEKLGFSYWTQFGSDITQLKEVSWDASQFVPDLVVINLGTNDNSYMQNVKGDRAKEEADFVADYVKFIEQIRSVHPDAEILCTLGIMGQELYPQIEEAVSTYKAASGDEKVNAYKFNQQNINKNGKGIDWHPAPQSHVEAAEELVAEIKKLYGWSADSSAVKPVTTTANVKTTKGLPPTSTTAKAPPKTIPKSSTKAAPTGVTTKAPPSVSKTKTTKGVPPTITTKAPPSVSTTKGLPPTSTTAKAPPKTIPKSSTKAAPTGVTTKAPPSVSKTKTTKGVPPTITTKAPPSVSTTKGVPPTITTKAPPSVSTTKGVPPTISTKAPPSVSTTKGVPPTISTKAPPSVSTTKSVPPTISTKAPPVVSTTKAVTTKNIPVPTTTTKAVITKTIPVSSTTKVITTKTIPISKSKTLTTKTIPISKSKTLTTKTIPISKSKTLTTKTIPISKSKTLTTKTIPISKSKTLTTKTIPISKSKTLTTKTIPRSKTLTTKTIPRSKTLTTKTIPRSKTLTTKTIAQVPTGSTSDDDYYSCASNDYDCKNKMAQKCYAKLNECWSKPYTEALGKECQEINMQCSKIYS